MYRNYWGTNQEQPITTKNNNCNYKSSNILFVYSSNIIKKKILIEKKNGKPTKANIINKAFKYIFKINGVFFLSK